MTGDAYIYANARIAALRSQLLSTAQLELLLSAKTADEAFDALNGTFLAPYIARGDRSQLARMVRKSLSAAKRLIVQIVPDDRPFHVLWMRYDFFNLKTIVKGRRAQLKDEEILERCFHAAQIAPDRLLAAVDADDVARLDTRLGAAYDAMRSATHVYDIDRASNLGYLQAVAERAQHCREPFVRDYARRVIDYYNLGTQLRIASLALDVDPAAVFAPGGTIALSELSSQEAILARYATMDGGPSIWRDAIATFTETKNFAVMEKAADDALLHFITAYPSTIESVVGVFAYFIALRNNIQIVRTIIAGKESGMGEAELRQIVRRVYTVLGDV